MENQSGTDPKIIAIISYLTFIGWIVALVLNSSKKAEFASFHIRQSLGIILLFVAGNIVGRLPLIGWAAIAVYIFAFVLWILGLLAAINNEEKPVPVLGEQFQQWFRSI